MTQLHDPGLPAGLVFLKLGGSLITVKDRPHTAKVETIQRLAGEIAAAKEIQPDLHLLLGHGSGSFGHIPAQRYGTRRGVHTAEQWHGFIEVWREATVLNRIVMDALAKAGLPAISFPPSASLSASNGQTTDWNLEPLISALRAGLLPVIYGDVIFDRELGGTIFSTEDLFSALALELKPQRILLAGIEPGVWSDYPTCKVLIEQVTPVTFPQIEASLSGSAAPDVTGGMASKVREMLALVEAVPGLEVQIFSGEEVGTVTRTLTGEAAGTAVRRG